MKIKILKCLRESTGYVSGQELCEKFQVSRTAIWKVIGQLKEDGYQIEAVRNKGYRIVKYPDVMTKEEIESLISTEKIGKKVYYFKEIDSTNAYAKRLAEESEESDVLIISETQLWGKGRRGRGWISPEGTGIWMSLLLRPKIQPNKAPMLTLVMAYSVALTLRELGVKDIGIKWPNDLVCNGKKICGILTEMSAEIDYIHHVVIGVGLNITTTTFPEDIENIATSLQLEGYTKIRRADLIAQIITRFEKQYNIFLQELDLKAIKDNYNKMLVNCNQEIRVLEPKHEYRAKGLGINELGELIVKKEDGTVVSVFAGEVSVRGIYGYV